jgi:hypothetical protein
MNSPAPEDAPLVDLLACQIDAYRTLNPEVTVREVLQALETIRHKLTEGLLRVQR